MRRLSRRARFYLWLANRLQRRAAREAAEILGAEIERSIRYTEPRPIQYTVPPFRNYEVLPRASLLVDEHGRAKQAVEALGYDDDQGFQPLPDGTLDGR